VARRLALAFAVALIAAEARAQPAPARVRLVLPACETAFDGAELVRVLRIELGADGVREVIVGEAQGALATIKLDATPCSAEAREVTVAIDDAATGKSVKRALAVTDTDAASRPRALGLAIAELLRASWSELEMPDQPKTPVPEEVLRAVRLRARPREAAPPAPPPSVLLGATLEARLFPAYQSVVLGPRLSASILVGGPLRARIDAAVAAGQAHDPLGTIDLTLATGGLGLLLAGGSEAVQLEIGPMLSAGGGWASGNPNPGNTGGSASAFVMTLQGLASAAVRLGPGWRGVVAVDAGGTLQRLDAESAGHAAAGFGGVVLGVGLGVAREL
jgi:hypothetical protein